MNLTLDLFIAVLAHAQSAADVLHVGQTCRTLYPFATKEIIRRGVKIAEDSQLPAFCRFITNDIDGRAPRLRILDIDLRTSPRADPCMIADLLSHCSQIEKLSLSLTIIMPPAERGLERAICALSKLRVLCMSCAEWNGMQDYTLVNLQSRQLRAAEILYTYCGQSPTQLTHPTHPVYTLVKQAPTLRKLLVLGSGIPLPATEGICYPHVTTLQLRHCVIGDLALLMRTFPNLRHLLADDAFVKIFPNASANVEVVDPWKGLDFLEGSLKLFRKLDILCPIRHWEISDWLCCSSIRDRRQFKIAVTKARISRLTAYLNLQHARDLENLFSENSHLNLSHISLQLNVTDTPSEEVRLIPVSEHQL